jgi:CBS domain-containing protein
MPTMSEQPVQGQGSYLTPSLEHALVTDAMRHGILTCFPDASLRAAAKTMTLHHIHTVVVNDPDDGGLVGVVSDSDLVAALQDSMDRQRVLADIVDRDFLTVASDQPLAEAAGAMRERGTAHAVVVDSHSGRPTGMLSTLDVLGVLAWGEA